MGHVCSLPGGNAARHCAAFGPHFLFEIGTVRLQKRRPNRGGKVYDVRLSGNTVHVTTLMADTPRLSRVIAVVFLFEIGTVRLQKTPENAVAMHFAKRMSVMAI